MIYSVRNGLHDEPAELFCVNGVAQKGGVEPAVLLGHCLNKKDLDMDQVSSSKNSRAMAQGLRIRQLRSITCLSRRAFSRKHGIP